MTFEYATKLKKPRIHIHRSAADYSDEAFFTLVRDQKFQERVVTETRDLLSNIPKSNS